VGYRPRVTRASERQPRYDGIAEWYDDFFSRYGDLADPLSTSSHLARLLGPGKGQCLDIACGGGLHHEAIDATGRTIVGVDLSGDQLRVAKRRALALLVRATAVALPFADASFPTVICTYLHTDIDDMVPVFLEVYRVLRPGGALVYLGVHPCFWGHFIENPVGPGRIVHPGYLETGWIDSPYWRNPVGLRARVGARHVTVSELVNAVVSAGLTLLKLEEPRARSGHADRLVIVAARPAPQPWAPVGF
jgi:SAM-dependent methyltransferase